MYNTAPELYNQLLEIYFNQYSDFSHAWKSKVNPKYDPMKLALDAYDYEEWFKKEYEETVDIPPMPPLEGDEEKYYSAPSTSSSKCVKRGKGIKILTPNKL